MQYDSIPALVIFCGDSLLFAQALIGIKQLLINCIDNLLGSNLLSTVLVTIFQRFDDYWKGELVQPNPKNPYELDVESIQIVKG